MPVKKKALTSEEEKRLTEAGYLLPLVRVQAQNVSGPYDYVLPTSLDVDFIRDSFPVHEDDVWVITPPKCGTTWMQEILWLLKNDVAKPTTDQFYRVPFLELGSIAPSKDGPYPGKDGELNTENLSSYHTHSLQYCVDLPRPRLLKTHLPLSLLPEGLLDKAKVIFVYRNVKDMAVSYYYHCQMKGYHKDFKSFAQLMREGIMLHAPMLPMVKEAWDQRHHPNMVVFSYEDMKADLRTVLDKLSQFLNVSLSEKKLLELQERVSFKSIKDDPLVNKSTIEFFQTGKDRSFIRKGVIGDWKEHFDEELNREWDAYIEEQLKSMEGFSMTYE